MSALLVLAALLAQAQSTPAQTFVVPESSARAYRIAQGKGTALLYVSAATGSPDAAVSMITFDTGAVVPEHAHETSAEILVVLEGAVDMVVAGKAVSAKAGDAIHLPRGVKHSSKVTAAVKAVQVFSPSGPEQRFTSGERIR